MLYSLTDTEFEDIMSSNTLLLTSVDVHVIMETSKHVDLT